MDSAGFSNSISQNFNRFSSHLPKPIISGAETIYNALSPRKREETEGEVAYVVKEVFATLGKLLFAAGLLVATWFAAKVVAAACVGLVVGGAIFLLARAGQIDVVYKNGAEMKDNVIKAYEAVKEVFAQGDPLILEAMMGDPEDGFTG